MPRDKSAKMAIWQKIATLPFWHFCPCSWKAIFFLAKWLLVECYERPIRHFCWKSVSSPAQAHPCTYQRGFQKFFLFWVGSSRKPGMHNWRVPIFLLFTPLKIIVWTMFIFTLSWFFSLIKVFRSWCRFLRRSYIVTISDINRNSIFNCWNINVLKWRRSQWTYYWSIL